MGCCLSKNDPSSKSEPSHSQIQQNVPKIAQSSGFSPKVEQINKQLESVEINPNPNPNPEDEGVKVVERVGEGKEVNAKKKEVFVIQHRKSNDKRPGGLDSDGSVSNSSYSGDPGRSESEEIGRNIMAAAASGQVVRTSSCTKEEVDAILIQCGRLSRSSSGRGNGNNGNNGNGGHGRRYSGSKRSFDFDRENEIVDDPKRNGNEEMIGVNYDDEERSRRRHSRGSNRRRTTPSRSRERDQQQQQQQRSGSRERSQSNGRRVSRSPGRRSESPMTHGNGSNISGNGRPGKLVSVPATVTSLSVEKGSNGNGGDGGNVKRVLVKRNVGSPRSQSPARAHSPVRGVNQGNVNGNGNGNGGGQQPVAASLSRNGSRKAEHSPYRRTPLNEIDINALPFHPLSNKRPVSRGKETEEDVVFKQPINSGCQSKYAETNNVKVSVQGTHRRSRSRGAEGYEITKTNYCRVNELQTPNFEQITEDKREQLVASEYDAMVTPVVVSAAETLKLPQTLMRSRSARRSRDLDISVEALLAPTPATDYNSLLLQDIQNFHQKKISNANAISNNAVSSNINASTPFTLPPCVSKACSIVEAVADLNSMTGSDDRRKSPKETNFSFNNVNKRVVESKDPFVESEVKVGDDLMEPSLHKYVTVRTKGGDLNDEESSGSNSFVGGSQQNWVSSSSWEPTSAESTDCWTSKSYSREELSPVGFQRHGMSDFVCGINEESERKCGNGGAARVRTVAGRGPISSTSKAAAASM